MREDTKRVFSLKLLRLNSFFSYFADFLVILQILRYFALQFGTTRAP